MTQQAVLSRTNVIENEDEVLLASGPVPASSCASIFMVLYTKLIRIFKKGPWK